MSRFSIARPALPVRVGAAAGPLFVACALTFGLAAEPGWCAPLDEGLAAYEAGRYAEAETLLAAPAQAGEGRARFALGRMYLLGQGAPADRRQAVHWFRMLAATGFADPDYDVRALFVISVLVPDDNPLGIYSYKKAAQNGDAEAQFIFAKIYDQARGVTENDNLAAVWYREAALQGHAAAAAHLGAMLSYGDGVPLDLEAGVDFLLQAGSAFVAEDRLVEALVALGMIKGLSPGMHRALLLEERIDQRLGALGLLERQDS